VILMTGHPIDTSEGFFRLLYKPFDLRKLAEAITAAMDQSQ
jgi:hypothetical protein